MDNNKAVGTGYVLPTANSTRNTLDDIEAGRRTRVNKLEPLL